VRNLRAEAGIKPGEKIEAMMQTESDREHKILTDGWFYIKDLAKVNHLSISQPNGSRTLPISTQELAQFDRSRPWVDKSWDDMSWAERFQLAAVFDLVGDFFQTYQRSLFGLGAIGLFVFVIELLKAILATVNQVPVLPFLLEVVGLGYAVWYGKRNIWDASERQRLWQQVQQLKQDIIGTPRFMGVTEVTATGSPTGNASGSASGSATGSATGTPTAGSQMFTGVIGTIQVLIPLAGLVDVADLRATLEKKRDKAENDIKSLTDRLGNAKFVDKAPAAVVQEVRDSLTEAQKQCEIIRDRLNLL
jgi:valyl-tRNA synthetase